MKKVIFIGGTAYSGSTFFDMTLANDPNAMSLGEVYAVFYPFRRKHLDLNALSNEIDWRELKEGGTNNLYSTLFDRFPDIEFIVDSSKSPLWISEQTKYLKNQNIDIRNILIWKTPQEFKISRAKRGHESGWIRAWLNYHRYYMSVINDWRSVKYSEYVNNKDTLKDICEVLGINYFEGKENFWEKKHHTLFGNASAKIHLVDKESKEFSKYNKEVKSTNDFADDTPQEKKAANKHKSIYYDEVDDADNLKYIADTRFKELLEIIEYTDVTNPEFNINGLKDLLKSSYVSTAYRMYQIIKLKYSPLNILDRIKR